MRVHGRLIVAVCLGAFSSARADGLLNRLPEDGTWARYSVKQTMALPNDKKQTVEGTLTLASVGKESVNGDACRWIEIVIEVKLPGQHNTTKIISKVLVPEKYLKKGEDPLHHWVKGWVRLGDQAPQALTKELLSNPAMMINLVASGPPNDAKPLEKKTIETKLGKLTCNGISGSLTLKGAAVDVNENKVTKKDIVVRVRNYFHDKPPFGVVSSHMDVEFPDLGEGKSTGEVDFVLVAVGTDAKSELPDRK